MRGRRLTILAAATGTLLLCSHGPSTADTCGDGGKLDFTSCKAKVRAVRLKGTV
jgi:hypothetical protein